MGPLEKTAVAIADTNLPITLVIIAGRNVELKQRLEARQWPMRTLVYGFVHRMPDFMRAADILVTKAGPSTITEALNAGLPMILYSRLPGQEDGNVDYVLSEGVGLWAPKTSYIVSALQSWITHPKQLELAAEACCQAARGCPGDRTHSGKPSGDTKLGVISDVSHKACPHPVWLVNRPGMAGSSGREYLPTMVCN
jgi:1,2-diacylglycerol 3-beta-galactosyltransferase